MMARHEEDDLSRRRRRSVESYPSDSDRPRKGREPSATEDRHRKSRGDGGRSSRDSRSRERGRNNRESRSHRHRSRSGSPDNKSRRHRERDNVEETRSRDRRYEKDSERGKRRDTDRDRNKGDRDRGETRSHRRRRSYTRSRSPQPRRDKSPSRSESHNEPAAISKRSKGPLPSQLDAFKGTPKGDSEVSTAEDKQKPNFSNTGRLAAETNTVNVNGGSIVLKYHEPPEARKPPAKEAWRLYIFKGEDLLDTVELGGRSCWLVGRERLVVDFPIDHPSCSKQHAAIQFRYIEKKNEYGDRDGRVRPYLIDLESANGSTVNGEPAPKGRYMELMDKDVLRFGLSTRECVLMLPPS